jgi:hypothetical protein
MSDTLPGLVVLAIGGSIAPPLLLLTILFLGTRQPLPNSGALALGYFTACAVNGISGLLLFGGAESAVYTVGRVISATVGALLIVMGLSIQQRCETVQNARRARLWSRAQTERLGYDRILAQPGRRQVRHR